MLQFIGRQEMTEMKRSGIEVVFWIRSNPNDFRGALKKRARHKYGIEVHRRHRRYKINQIRLFFSYLHIIILTYVFAYVIIKKKELII